MSVRNGFAVVMRDGRGEHIDLTGGDLSQAVGKIWMWAISKPEGSPVAFVDWFDMIRALGACEVLKYNGDPAKREDWERWTRLPRLFMEACWAFEATYEDLRAEFGLPR